VKCSFTGHVCTAVASLETCTSNKTYCWTESHGLSHIGAQGYRVTGVSRLAGLARLVGLSKLAGLMGLVELAELAELGGWLDMRSYQGWRLELGVRVHQPGDTFQR